MDAPILTKEELAARFASGGLCSQCTLEPWADALGYDVEELRRMSAGFGGGMFRGDTCGGVTGAPGHNAAREILRDFRQGRIRSSA